MLAYMYVFILLPCNTVILLSIIYIRFSFILYIIKIYYLLDGFMHACNFKVALFIYEFILSNGNLKQF